MFARLFARSQFARPSLLRRQLHSDASSSDNSTSWLWAFPVVTLGLGGWQVYRLQWKLDLIETAKKMMAQEAVPLDAALTDEGKEFQRIRIDGRFIHDKEMLVGLRTRATAAADPGRSSSVGYYVLTPFEMTDGRRVIVNRGWIPRAFADKVTRAASQVGEAVTIETVVRKGEKASQFPQSVPEKNEWYCMDVDGMARSTNSLPVLADMIIDSEINKPLLRLTGAPLARTPDINITNNHLMYAPSVLTSPNGHCIDPDRKLPRAHDWSATILADGRHFADEHGRTLLVRGVNLCANSKLPTKSSESITDHRNVSFIGRPFRLDEVDEHFKRLRGWGLTFVRLLVSWEALEHSGPGIYDEEFIDYLILVLKRMAKYGIKCFIDPHQDTWSRFSGGSGAPGWTFEVAGLDLTMFQKAGAAHINDIQDESRTKHMFWPTNYAKLACCTMFTLFFGGDTFAPKTLYKGESVQSFLQRHYINAFTHLARRVQDCVGVMGFEVMNEPHFGYIGMPSIYRFDPLTTLHYGPFPSALESFALGSGASLEVDNWVQSWPHPTRKAGKKRVNEEEVSVWLNDGKCIWEEHGLWKMENGKPVALKPDYFSKHPVTGKKIDFNNEFYLPFIRSYIKSIQSAKSDYIVFFEPIPNEDPPVFDNVDLKMKNVVYAPHWYDLKTLFSKGTKSILAATYFGVSGASKNYGGQIGNIVKAGIQRVGTKPVLLGECGMPMDINKKKAFETGDYKLHTDFLDACLTAFEANLVNFTLWNYNPMNDNTYGDYWNGEDFSIYSPKPSRPMSTTGSVSSISSLLGQPAIGSSERIKTPEPLKKAKPGKSKLTDITPLFIDEDPEAPPLETIPSVEQMPTTPFEITNFYFQDDGLALEGDPDHHHHDGGRALDAIIRPFASKIAGLPLVSRFNLRKLVYTLEFVSYAPHDKNDGEPGGEEVPISRITEIFLPNYHFGFANGIQIKVSDGEWKFDKKKQTLYWAYDPDYHHSKVQEVTPLLAPKGVKHWIRVSVPGYQPKYSGVFGWTFRQMDEFDDACEYISKTNITDTNVLLKLYGLFKIVREGECMKPRPGMFDLQGRAKWDSWKSLGSMRKEDAAEAYVELVRQHTRWGSTDPQITGQEPVTKGVSTGPSVSIMVNEDPHIIDADKTIFDWAAEGDVAKMRGILLKNPNLIQQRDESGRSPLHWASDRGHLDLVKYLVESKAEVNLGDDEGLTALHNAAVSGHIHIASVLLEAGADPEMKDLDGMTPEDYGVIR
ncbi:hypothetical protein HDU67_007205 [Dinochytrium kinnereticum]|nr:hypothetical protein HDU67_007205 [Dinochytrium kinnereticum]